MLQELPFIENLENIAKDCKRFRLKLQLILKQQLVIKLMKAVYKPVAEVGLIIFQSFADMKFINSFYQVSLQQFLISFENEVEKCR